MDSDLKSSRNRIQSYDVLTVIGGIALLTSGGVGISWAIDQWGDEVGLLFGGLLFLMFGFVSSRWWLGPVVIFVAVVGSLSYVYGTGGDSCRGEAGCEDNFGFKGQLLFGVLLWVLPTLVGGFLSRWRTHRRQGSAPQTASRYP